MAASRTRSWTTCTVRVCANAVHVIPKPTEEQGLVVGWPSTKPNNEELDDVRGGVSPQVYKKMMEKL